MVLAPVLVLSRVSQLKTSSEAPTRKASSLREGLATAASCLVQGTHLVKVPASRVLLTWARAQVEPGRVPCARGEGGERASGRLRPRGPLPGVDRHATGAPRGPGPVAGGRPVGAHPEGVPIRTAPAGLRPGRVAAGAADLARHRERDRQLGVLSVTARRATGSTKAAGEECRGPLRPNAALISPLGPKIARGAACRRPWRAPALGSGSRHSQPFITRHGGLAAWAAPGRGGFGGPTPSPGAQQLLELPTRRALTLAHGLWRVECLPVGEGFRLLSLPAPTSR